SAVSPTMTSDAVVASWGDRPSRKIRAGIAMIAPPPPRAPMTAPTTTPTGIASGSTRPLCPGARCPGPPPAGSAQAAGHLVEQGGGPHRARPHRPVPGREVDVAQVVVTERREEGHALSGERGQVGRAQAAAHERARDPE